MNPRAVDPALVEALGQILLHRHASRGTAAVGETLRDELCAEGYPVGCVRRVQEAIRELRFQFARKGRTQQIASGPEGYWLEADLEILRLTNISHKRRVARSAEALRWTDPDAYDRLTQALFPEGA